MEKQSVSHHQSAQRMRKSDCTLMMMKMTMQMTKMTMTPGEQSLPAGPVLSAVRT